MTNPITPENETKLNKFFAETKAKNIQHERDELIFEMAKRLELTEDKRYSYLIEHIRQSRNRPVDDIKLSVIQKYKEAVHAIMKENPDNTASGMEIFMVLIKINGLIEAGKWQELMATLITTFPEE